MTGVQRSGKHSVREVQYSAKEWGKWKQQGIWGCGDAEVVVRDTAPQVQAWLRCVSSICGVLPTVTISWTNWRKFGSPTSRLLEREQTCGVNRLWTQFGVSLAPLKSVEIERFSMPIQQAWTMSIGTVSLNKRCSRYFSNFFSGAEGQNTSRRRICCRSVRSEYLSSPPDPLDISEWI